ncbi:MAG: hypothetical protein WC679_00810 [Bacteroidales bacterium]|jgi:hypothetical protein
MKVKLNHKSDQLLLIKNLHAAVCDEPIRVTIKEEVTQNGVITIIEGERSEIAYFIDMIKLFINSSTGNSII